jgi:hypothetical protein
VAEAARKLRDRLLRPRRERRFAAHEPHAVVQVQDVHRGFVPSTYARSRRKRVMEPATFGFCVGGRNSIGFCPGWIAIGP